MTRKILSLCRPLPGIIKIRKPLFYRAILGKENRDSVLIDWIPENLQMVVAGRLELSTSSV